MHLLAQMQKHEFSRRNIEKRTWNLFLWFQEALKNLDGDLRLELADFDKHPVHKAPTYHFRMVHAVTDEELETIRLRVGSTRHVEMYAGQTGYAVHPAHRARHYASRALRLLVPVARHVGLDPLWITCDPENHASRRCLELAGPNSLR